MLIKNSSNLSRVDLHATISGSSPKRLWPVSFSTVPLVVNSSTHITVCQDLLQIPLPSAREEYSTFFNTMRARCTDRPRDKNMDCVPLDDSFVRRLIPTHVYTLLSTTTCHVKRKLNRIKVEDNCEQNPRRPQTAFFTTILAAL